MENSGHMIRRYFTILFLTIVDDYVIIKRRNRGVGDRVTGHEVDGMEEVNILTFKATCLALLEKVKRTQQSILIIRRGEPIAQVIPAPLPEKPVSWIGCMKGTGTIEGDVMGPILEEGEWEVLGR